MGWSLMTSRCWRRAGTAAFAVAVAAMAVVPLHGQAPECHPLSTDRTCATDGWDSPLDRLVSLATPDLPLRDALGQLADAAGVRLSYSAESLDGDRRVCLSLADIPLGDALRALLPTGSVTPTIAAPDHVVLAVVGTASRRDSGEPTSDAVIALEQIVVTSDAGVPPRGLSYAVDVIDADEIAARAIDDLPRLLSATVPGLWAWISSPSDLQVQYGSVRGASSFGATYPKVYLDGIQVANPLVLAQLTPEAIERIEVIRGPQGAALYGTDAISGVVNIQTRRRASESGTPHLQLRSTAGLVASDFSPGNVLAQDHVVTGWLGDPAQSANFSLAGGSTGELVPEARSRYLSLNGSGRSVGSHSMVTATGRLNFARVRSGISPMPGNARFQGAIAPASGFSGADIERSALQYTLGTTLNSTGAHDWTHSIVIGVDGYRLSPAGEMPGTFPGSGVGPHAGGAGDRLSIRASSVWQIAATRAATAALTFGGERTLLREQNPVAAGHPAPVAEPGASTAITWHRTTGLVARGSASFGDLLYLDAGLRLEADDGFGAGSGFQPLPMLGAAIVADHDRLSAKIRTAYGKGIRPARTALRETLWPAGNLPPAALALPPESQSGIEVGLDLDYDGRFAFGITRFDQLASGLIQAVVIDRLPAVGVDPARTLYLLRNVSQISNTGWEFETSTVFDRLALDATFSSVDSRVRRLARGYAGDLQPGDRMLEVPARTASLAATWVAPRWSASITASRAWSWINYDRIRLSRIAETDPELDATGPWLRDFWREFDGTPRVTANATFDLRPGLSLLVGADNLFDNQLGEPDNLSIVPGRTFSLGFRGSF
jgi:outer membrane receptor protein involved in Fe transport